MGKFSTNEGQEFERRPGTDPFGGAGWRGTNTEDDPGSLEPNELQHAVDFRIRGKNLYTRPGHIERIDLGDKPILWMKALPIEPSKMWSSTVGCAGALNGFGFELAYIDPSQNPIQQIYLNGAKSSDKFTPLGKYGDQMYMGEDSTLRVVRQIGSPYGVSSLSTFTTNPGEVVREFPGYVIRCMFEQGGLFFIGLQDTTTPGASKIVVYNGAGYKDDLTGIRPPLAMGNWRDKLVVIFDSTAAHIRVRDSGSSSPGAWTTYALAGFSGSSTQNALQEYRGKTWIASGGDRLYSFDGATGTLALERTVAGCDNTSSSSGLSSLCLHHGILHYGWNTTLTFGGRIGRYDADSTTNLFVDTYLNITAQLSGFTNLSSMGEYRNRIHAGGADQWVVATKENDVQGVVEKIAGGTIPSSLFIIKQLMVFP